MNRIAQKGWYLSVGVLICMMFIFIQDVTAYNQKQINTTESYSFRYQSKTAGVSSRNYGTGSVTINNTIDMIEGALNVCPGKPINFSHNAELTFVKNGGFWDTPRGKWMGNLSQWPGDYFNSTYWQKFTDNYVAFLWNRAYPSNNYGYVSWTGIKPVVTNMTSSNSSVVSCNGLNCTANATGTAYLTARVPETQVKIWAWITNLGYKTCMYKNGCTCDPRAGCPGSCEVDYNNCPRDEEARRGDWKEGEETNGCFGLNGTCSNVMTMPTATNAGDRWKITVTNPVNAVCGNANNGTYMTTTEVSAAGRCSVGTASAVTDTGTGWSWTCTGTCSPAVPCVAAKPESACASEGPYTYAWNVTNWPSFLDSHFCLVGAPNFTPRQSNFPEYGQTITWGCEGGSSPTAPNACSATRSVPPPCECGSNNNSFVGGMPSTNACLLGTMNLQSSANGTWTWTCNEDSSCTPTSSPCSAECVQIDIDAPSNIYLKKNGNKLKVKVRVDGHQNVQNGGTCDITFGGVTKTEIVQNGGSTNEVEFDYEGAGAIIEARCTLNVDCGGGSSYTEKEYTDTQQVTSLCAERSCTAQGTCQSTPKSGITSVDDCSSTCSSNADCTTGRMIETRP